MSLVLPGSALSLAPGPPEEPRTTIATLRPGDQIEGIFACTRKERQISRAGTPYLTVELRDRTGSILGRVFKDADLLAGTFERGDLIAVHATVERFRDQLQLSIARILPVDPGEVDPAEFLPASRRDLDELEGFLEHLVREIYDPGLRALAERVLARPEIREGLRRAPCAIPAGGPSAAPRGTHHAYLGGLLEHTVAVATMAIELCAVHPRLDRDLLLCAALLHDIGRTREFSYGAQIQRTPEGTMLGHVQLGLRIIDVEAPPGLDPQRRLALEHCLITHHGPDSSPGGRFASAEAIALYRLNALDAHVKSALEGPASR